MPQIEATYQGGGFKPGGHVHLKERQRVLLFIQPIEPTDALAWLERAQRHRQQILDRRGGQPFPEHARHRRGSDA